MRRLPVILALALAFALAMAGCSGDEHPSPTAVSGPDSVDPVETQKAIGPSEIVLCLDVSAAMDAAELQSAVSALVANLSDPALIPQDGTMEVAVLVYGDTAAGAVATLTPVTPGSLEETILPAVAGLVDDRLVSGTVADLAAALDQALVLLDPGSVQDRHVLALGSGTVADADAVEASCAALGLAGVMVSTIAGSATDVFAACAAATGGFFELAGDDPTGAMAAALAYMLQVDLDLQPETAERLPGEEHELTASLFRGSDPAAFPVEGANVDFTVIEGPNAGLEGSVSTDAAGLAAFSYAGEGGLGTDTIVAMSLHPGTGVALTDTVTVLWDRAAPICDPGGPYVVIAGDAGAELSLDGSGSSDPDDDPLSFLWSVDCEEAAFDDPTAVMPLLSITGACLDLESLLVELMVTDGTDTSRCETEVVLVTASFQLEPETAERMRGEEHTVTATATYAELPVEGMELDFSVIDGPNAGDAATLSTDAEGRAVFSYPGDGGPGTDTIVAAGNYPESGEAVSDTVSVTWFNTAPECDAGGPYAVTVTGDLATVTLDGSLSNDADEDELSYLWTVDCDAVSIDDPGAVMPTVEITGECLCAGSLAVELSVSDGLATVRCETVIELDDQRPPRIAIREEPLVLWPPNHNYHAVEIEDMFSAETACGDPLPLPEITVIRATSDEPENAWGLGDGHTWNDIDIRCPDGVQLRAERDGRGNGRVYTIHYRYLDANGDPVELTGQVIVPHDDDDPGAIDDGPEYTEAGDCD